MYNLIFLYFNNSLKKDAYICKKTKKQIKHVIRSKESAKKNYVMENISNIPEKLHESSSPTKDLGKWPRSVREIFNSIIYIYIYLYYFISFSLSIFLYL